MYQVEINILHDNNEIEKYIINVEAETTQKAKIKALEQCNFNEEDILNIKIRKTP